MYWFPGESCGDLSWKPAPLPSGVRVLNSSEFSKFLSEKAAAMLQGWSLLAVHLEPSFTWAAFVSLCFSQLVKLGADASFQKWTTEKVSGGAMWLALRVLLLVGDETLVLRTELQMHIHGVLMDQ